jgi:hypothetical protein
MFGKTKKAILLAGLILVSTLSAATDVSASLEQRVAVDGTGYTVVPAEGYEKLEHNGVTVLCNGELDSCLFVEPLKNGKKISDLDRGKLIEHYVNNTKYKLVSFRDFKFGSYQGILLEKDDRQYRNWVLFFGDDDGITIATVNVNLEKMNSRSRNIAHSMLGTLRKRSK